MIATRRADSEGGSEGSGIAFSNWKKVSKAPDRKGRKNCRRGVAGALFAGLLMSRVDFRRGRKLEEEVSHGYHISRVACEQGQF